MDAPKPCKFCGAGFKMGQEPKDAPYVGGKFYLYHDYGPLGSAARKCPISVAPHFDTKAEAIAAWNRRADLTAPDMAELVEAASRLLGMVDALIAESGRSIEWGEEDPFRMGEWFEPEDLAQIEQARAALAKIKEPQT